MRSLNSSLNSCSFRDNSQGELMIDLTASGHSPSQEKDVARRLYISIIAVIILGMALFFVMGQKPALEPNATRPAVQSEPNAAPASR